MTNSFDGYAETKAFVEYVKMSIISKAKTSVINQIFISFIIQCLVISEKF